jgi:curved DNA-binding protein
MSEGEFVDYYALLGLAPDAEPGQIRAAFLRKAQEHHPDVGGSDESMQVLNAAYKTLKDSNAKAAYDMIHSVMSGVSELPQYKYDGGNAAKDVDDMSDEEIDEFLDTMFKEFRHGVPKQKQPLKQRIKKIFEI